MFPIPLFLCTVLLKTVNPYAFVNSVLKSPQKMEEGHDKSPSSTLFRPLL